LASSGRIPLNGCVTLVEIAIIRDRGYLHSAVFLQQPTFGWHKTSTIRDLRFSLHSFIKTFIQTPHSIFYMKAQVQSLVS